MELNMPQMDLGAEQESSTTVEQPTQASPTPAEQQIIDLDSTDKWKYGGKEWTSQEWKDSHLMHGDYTKKTQALAEERRAFEDGIKRYYDNLDTDLKSVASNPALVAEFKRIYPEKFHAYLDNVIRKEQATGANPNSSAIPQEFMKRFESLESSIQEQRVNAINAELDAKFSVLQKKYPSAIEEMVLTRADGILKRGHVLDDKQWDQFFKDSHDQIEAHYKKTYGQKVKEQQSANLKGKDIAGGGGVPGRAPVEAKSIRAMSNLLRESGTLDQL